MRRAIGAVLASSGALALLFTSATWTEGALARSRARTEWQIIEAHQATVAARRLATSPGTTAAALGTPVARLQIPHVGLDEVVVEGVGPLQLNAGPGHLPGTVLPGATGNSIVSAHRDRHFHPLGDVQIGDEIITEAAGITTHWRVVSTRVVAATSAALFNASSATLTLTTCWPLSYVGPAPDRLIVVAKPIA